MMKIVLNGHEREVAASTSVQGLLHDAGYAERRIAVEINREIVPRSQFDQRLLDPGDRVEIVHAIGGG